MADYDQGMDLLGETHDLIVGFLMSQWEMGKGLERANEYNCSNAENMAMVINHLQLDGYYFKRSPEKEAFLADVMRSLKEGIDSYSRKDHPWRKEAVKDLQLLTKMLEDKD